MSLSTGSLPSRSPFAGAAPLAPRPLNAIAATTGGNVPQARIKRLLAELLAPLQALHDRGRICGDITTASVGLDENGRAHLMAVDTQPRQAEGAPAAPVAGFAPYEFYLQSPQWPRGPWSDIYSLSAVVHSLITGSLPPPAAERMAEDRYRPLAEQDLPRYDREFLQAIDAGLAVNPVDRPETVAAFAASLAFAPADEAADLATIPPIELRPAAPRTEYVAVQHSTSNARRYVLAVVLLLVTAGVGTYWWDRLATTSSPVIAASQPVLLAQATPMAPVQSLPMASASDAPQGPAAPIVAESLKPAIEESVRALKADTPPAEPVNKQVLPAAPATPAAPVPDNVASASPQELLQPKPAVARVAVRVNIQPWGEVWVNGQNRGVSPPLRELRLAPGKYSIVVRNADLPAYRDTLEVKAGQSAAINHTFR